MIDTNVTDNRLVRSLTSCFTVVEAELTQIVFADQVFGATSYHSQETHIKMTLLYNDTARWMQVFGILTIWHNLGLRIGTETLKMDCIPSEENRVLKVSTEPSCLPFSTV